MVRLDKARDMAVSTWASQVSAEVIILNRPEARALRFRGVSLRYTGFSLRARRHDTTDCSGAIPGLDYMGWCSIPYARPPAIP